jgi:UDP-N-acetylmuramyl pentapeptide phosphotransferase/UDP-N-acetylglucosamine-1-phosphate transferase
MKYILLTVFLLIIEVIYIRLAVKLFIVDRPNERSSHARKTITGGGIIFWFAAFIWFLLYYPQAFLFTSGITIISVVSFGDDIHKYSHERRLITHVLGFTLMLLSFDIFNYLSWYEIAAAYIVMIGIMNAYNFMDGINGITGLYSLSVLGALQFVNLKTLSFTYPDFIWYPMIACIIFLFFNFRKKAVCFAGDVGSLTIAFWIVSLLLILLIKSKTIIWLNFLAIYGIDSILTILHRLYLRQNIFQAHRLHFYQILANECRIDHRIVSSGYALLQLALSAVVIMLWDKMNFFVLTAIILVPLILAYMLKFRLMKKLNSVKHIAGPSVKKTPSVCF